MQKIIVSKQRPKHLHSLYKNSTDALIAFWNPKSPIDCVVGLTLEKKTGKFYLILQKSTSNSNGQFIS